MSHHACATTIRLLFLHQYICIIKVLFFRLASGFEAFSLWFSKLLFLGEQPGKSTRETTVSAKRNHSLGKEKPQSRPHSRQSTSLGKAQVAATSGTAALATRGTAALATSERERPIECVLLL